MIVESNLEKEQFLEYWNNEQSIVIPIWEDLERHPMTCDVSFLYVRFQNLDFVLPFNHNDCEPIEIDLSESTSMDFLNAGILLLIVKLNLLENMNF